MKLVGVASLNSGLVDQLLASDHMSFLLLLRVMVRASIIKKLPIRVHVQLP